MAVYSTTARSTLFMGGEDCPKNLDFSDKSKKQNYHFDVLGLGYSKHTTDEFFQYMNYFLHLIQTDANAANAIAAIASAIMAALALFISTVSVFVSVRALKIQRHHNVLSVCPLPEVTVADYENSLRVKIRNNGSGPLLIKEMEVTNGNESHSRIIEWMPILPGGRYWNDYSQRIENRSILPGDNIVLIELTEGEGETDFATCRDLCRKALSPLIISVTFTDVYQTKFQPYVKSLDWFGRHVNDT